MQQGQIQSIKCVEQKPNNRLHACSGKRAENWRTEKDGEQK